MATNIAELKSALQNETKMRENLNYELSHSKHCETIADKKIGELTKLNKVIEFLIKRSWSKRN